MGKILKFITVFSFGITSMIMLIAGHWIAFIITILILFLLTKLPAPTSTELKSMITDAVVVSDEVSGEQQYSPFNDDRIKYPRTSVPKLLDFVVLDFETTGLSEYQDYIVEIGAIRFRNGVEEERFNTYVKPPIPMPEAASQINGIFDYMLHKAPKIANAMPRLVEFIGADLLVSHNSDFDMKFLLANTSAQLENRVFCTLRYAQNHFNFRNNKLETICKSFGIEFDNAHSALDDCSATAQVYLKMHQHYNDQKKARKNTTGK